ncbi:putative CRAL-TRIO lipid binding domain superfamily [Helianthus annuus]|nr:putative CRAL-TRIO lipid binding domain superfamily [Helianthus annuus]
MVHYYVQSHIQINEYCDRVILLLQTISTVDDLNYPEKTITYYTVNVPYVFSACWKVSFRAHCGPYITSGASIPYFGFISCCSYG